MNACKRGVIPLCCNISIPSYLFLSLNRPVFLSQMQYFRKTVPVCWHCCFEQLSPMTIIIFKESLTTCTKSWKLLLTASSIVTQIIFKSAIFCSYYSICIVDYGCYCLKLIWWKHHSWIFEIKTRNSGFSLFSSHTHSLFSFCARFFGILWLDGRERFQRNWKHEEKKET